jgi:hypothetical protein
MSNAITSNESTHESTESKDPRVEKAEAAVAEVVESAVDLGKLWARHGLTIGKLALETSAVSLGTTARMLSNLADALSPVREEKEAKTDKAA